MAQALARERPGFQRFPGVTAPVFPVTAVSSVLAGPGWGWAVPAERRAAAG